MSTNILITSAGTASAINVVKALRSQQEYDVRLFAVDVDPTAPGLYLVDEHAIVPGVSQNEYIPTLLQLCEDHQISALYPIYSQEIEVVAENVTCFTGKGIGVLLPKPDVVRMCNDKRRMYKLASDLGIATPRIIGDDQFGAFPIFAKPNSSSGTRNAFRIDDNADLLYAQAKYPNLLYQEFVEGTEYTVDILCDQQSSMIACSPRVRLATRAGQCVKGRTVEEPVLNQMCGLLCKEISMVGPCNIQFIKRHNEFVFIELNPRYAAGGLMLTVKAGANLPLLALKLMLKECVNKPDIQPDVLMLRYWEELFL